MLMLEELGLNVLRMLLSQFLQVRRSVWHFRQMMGQHRAVLFVPGACTNPGVCVEIALHACFTHLCDGLGAFLQL